MIRMTLVLSLVAASATGAIADTSWDADGDGALNPQEFADGFIAMATFAKFDADSSGALDADEWEAGLTPVGEYANMDLNGDGGVDEAEYTALLFNRYDADGSGTVDNSEAEVLNTDLTAGMLAR
ncbi:MAG: hypothetical protein AAGF30_16200 [Pseudomonadota bacterium]